MTRLQKFAWIFLAVNVLLCLAYTIVGLARGFMKATVVFDYFTGLLSLANVVLLFYIYDKTGRDKPTEDPAKAADNAAANARDRAINLRALRISAFATLAIALIGINTIAWVYEKKGQVEISVPTQAVSDATFLTFVFATILWSIIVLVLSGRQIK